MKYLLLPLAAIGQRSVHARLTFVSSLLGFLLFGIAAGINTSLKFVSSDPRRAVQLDLVTLTIVSLGLLTMLFLTGSAIAQSVRSHIKELAVLKAIGFSSGRIVTFVFLEAAIPCAAGALLGLALSVPCAAWIVGLLPQGNLLPAPRLTSRSLASALACATGLPLLSVVIPAYRVVRLDPAKALSR